jgi:hypothetical protein
MKKIIMLLVLLALTSAQDYLPKEGPVPICDIFAKDISRSGYDFWKVDRSGWVQVFSALPIRPFAVT